MKDALTEAELVEIAEKEVMRLPEQEREDAAQEFILGALTALKKAKEGGAVRTYQWVYGRGFVQQFIRKGMTRRKHEVDSLSRVVKDDGKGVLHLYDVLVDPKAEQPETDLDESEARDRLGLALDTLTRTQREIVTRRYLNGESADTVAEALDCTRANVYLTEKTALEKLHLFLIRKGSR